MIHTHTLPNQYKSTETPGRDPEETYFAVKRGLRSFVDAVLAQAAIDEAARPFFREIPPMVDSIKSDGDAWLSHVFGKSPERYGNEPLIEHAVNVATLSVAVGHRLRMAPDGLVMLALGGCLHDLGMFLLPPELLSSGKTLTPQDRHRIESHPQLGRDLILEAGLRDAYAQIAFQEQERWDGSGYPRKKEGKGILLHAQIIGLCDSVESLTHPRPYRPVQSFEEGLRRLIGDGIHRFSRSLWQALLRRLTPYPPGTVVYLSDGTVARVSRVNPYLPFSPLVERSSPVTSFSSSRWVDLSDEPSIRIECALPPLEGVFQTPKEAARC